MQEQDTTQAAGREELHHRQLDLRCWRRADGLLEVEARLLDTKAQPFRRQLGASDTPAGAALHDIRVRLVADETMTVREVEASMPATPFDTCPGAAPSVQRLVGERIGKGWNRRVRELLGGYRSCTHIVELLGPMATTLHQGLAPQRMAALAEPANEALRVARVDGCHAYAADGEVVARLWPHLSRARDAAADGG